MHSLHVPPRTKQALIMMQGVQIFLEPNLTASAAETGFLPTPAYVDVVGRSATLPRKPRTLQDIHAMVTMVPKEAILLTILLDNNSQVYICEYILDEQTDSMQQHWWSASAYALQMFHFKQVFAASSVVHAWLHFNRENKINLAVFDISTHNTEAMQHLPIHHRSGQLHKMFCEAVKQHGNVGQLSWLWVGELGHDGETHTPASGACAVILQDNWCFDIDYLLKFTQHTTNTNNEQQDACQLIQAMRPHADYSCSSPSRKRFKSLSLHIPPAFF